MLLFILTDNSLRSKLMQLCSKRSNRPGNTADCNQLLRLLRIGFFSSAATSTTLLLCRLLLLPDVTARRRIQKPGDPEFGVVRTGF